MSDPDAKPCGHFHGVECDCMEQRAARVEEQDAEIATLRERLAKAERERDAKGAQVLLALSERDASRALADRMGEALREAESALQWALDRSPAAAAEMVKESAPWRTRARAALREWEEARRG